MNEDYGKYIWDDSKNQRNVELHGISFQRATIALEEGCSVDGDKSKYPDRHEKLTHLNGETIKVVYDDNTRIITAHKNERKFDQQYNEKIARSGIKKNEAFNKEFAAWKKLDEKQQVKTKRKVKQFIEQNKELYKKDKKEFERKARIDREPRIEKFSKERAEFAKKIQKEQQVHSPLMVEDRSQRGEPQKVTDYVKTLAPKEQNKENFSEKQMYYVNRREEQHRRSALDSISRDIKAGENLNTKDIKNLNKEDLKKIDNPQGDEHLKKIVKDHEQQREQEQKRER